MMITILFLTSIAMHAADAGANAPAAAERAIAQLRAAEVFLAERNPAAAKAEFAKVAAVEGAPAHLRAEAEERIREIERIEKNLPGRDLAATRTRSPKPPAPGAVLHVAPNGADTDPGTEERPFATLERARDEVRAIKKRAGLPSGGIAIMARGGRYPIRRTFTLGAEDSGADGTPIIYRAAGGDAPIFTGGVRLTGFQPVKDPAVAARLPEEARDKVICVDLAAHGVTNILPLVLGGFSSGRGFTTHPVMELFFNGAALPLARWPNDGFMRVAGLSVADGHQIHGLQGSKTGRFTYEGDRPLRWKDERDILLYGYWFWDWADSYERVSSIDTAKHEMTLDPPYHTYGYRTGQPFYALNLLAEIDQAGEWYLDRASGFLYLYPPSDPGQAVIELSTAPYPFVALENVSHVTFQGIVWELGCADGAVIRGGDHCCLAGCAVRRFGGNGIVVAGGAAHALLSCDIESMGRGGVTVSGGDRTTLAAGGHLVENCHIRDLSRVDHTYTPAVLLDGVGNRVAHNLMHDIRSSAMRVGGNDHLIEFNEVCRAVLESDDQGGVDMFGNPTFRGNVYRHNYFHHIGNWRQPREAPACGQAGIRLDDAISGVLIYGNVFHRCAAGKLGFGGVQIHGGKDNIVDANLFVECATAISFSPWNDSYWRSVTGKALEAIDIDKARYLARYPDLARLDEDLNRNDIWRNVAFRCGEFLRRNGGANRLLDNNETAEDPGFTDAAHGAFQRAPSAPGLERLGLPPIPFEEIGLYRDDLRTELPADRVARMRSEP
jgi:hypothetical protein